MKLNIQYRWYIANMLPVLITGSVAVICSHCRWIVQLSRSSTHHPLPFPRPLSPQSHFLNEVASLAPLSLLLRTHSLRGVCGQLLGCVCLIPVALWESIMPSSGEWLPLTRPWHYKLLANLFTPYISEARSLCPFSVLSPLLLTPSIKVCIYTSLSHFRLLKHMSSGGVCGLFFLFPLTNLMNSE